MKKIICLAIILFSMAAFVNAATMAIMPKIGLDLATQRFSPALDTSTYASKPMKLGFVGGVGFDYNLAVLGLEADVLFEQKGLKLTQADSSYSTETFNYLDVPILAKYNLKLGGSVLFLGVGPEFSLLLGTAQEKDYDSSGNLLTTTALTSAYKVVDFGIAIALGFEMYSFVIDARYSIGVGDTSNMVSDTKIRNDVLSFMVGYKISL